MRVYCDSEEDSIESILYRTEINPRDYNILHKQMIVMVRKYIQKAVKYCEKKDLWKWLTSTWVPHLLIVDHPYTARVVHPWPADKEGSVQQGRA